MMARALFCEFCGEALLSGDTFCGFCGRKLPAGQPGRGLHFVVVEGELIGQIIPLTLGEMVLGRGEQADVKINDLAVSRQHAQLTVQAGDLSIRDLSTANGTLVNGTQLLGLKRVKPGDRIKVGQTVLELQQAKEQPVPPPIKPPERQGVQAPTASKPIKKKRSRVLTLALGVIVVVICALAALIVLGRSAITAWFDSSPVGSSNAMITVQLVNQASEDVCFVHISPSSEDQWGEDWLGEQETIPPGGTRSFSLQPGLVFDWIALNCGQEVLTEGYQLVAESGLQLNVSP